METEDLTRPVLRRLPARDGLELTGWLYRPDGPPPWPAAIHLHGGPEAQERPVYNSLFQSLVAAGIAVFAPNVRGSSGFGRAFLVADDRDKRFAAIDDVAACVDHLVRSGVAQPGRVACMGRSYGGYLTLAALVEHPELFAAGVDVCGMADFATFYRHTEPWIAAAAVAEYGDPVRDADLLRALSPIHRIDRLTAPLLVVHGADDTNVPVEEAEQVVAALAARGVEHEYLLFEGEGHELLSTPNRVAFVRATVAWLTRHLRSRRREPGVVSAADRRSAPGRHARVHGPTDAQSRFRSATGSVLTPAQCAAATCSPRGWPSSPSSSREPLLARVERLAALDPGELDRPQLVAALLVLADDAAAAVQGHLGRQVGALLDEREVLAVRGGGPREVAALLHHRLLGAEPLGELLAEPGARVDRVELDVAERVPLHLLAAGGSARRRSSRRPHPRRRRG